MSADKRRSDRHPVRFKLVYDDGESFNAGLVRDLSESGVFIETSVPLQIGKTVVLSSLDMEDDRSFDLNARVTRIVEGDEDAGDGPLGMGLEFEEITDAQRVLLQGLIEQLEEETDQFEGDLDPFFGKSLPRQGLARSPSGVWRPPPSVQGAAAEPRAAREPRSGGGGSESASAEDSDDEEASPDQALESVEVTILDPEDEIRFEQPRDGPTVTGLASPNWETAPWRAQTRNHRIPFPLRADLWGRACEDLSTVLQEVVSEQGKDYPDKVLLDEAAVSPLLVSAHLEEVAIEPDGSRPLEAADFGEI